MAVGIVTSTWVWSKVACRALKDFFGRIRKTGVGIYVALPCGSRMHGTPILRLICEKEAHSLHFLVMSLCHASTLQQCMIGGSEVGKKILLSFHQVTTMG
jgi:hypothetical protein